MRALCWHGKGDIRVDTVPGPTIEHPRDAIVNCGEPENVATVEGSLMPGRVAAKPTSGERTGPKPALPDNHRSRATARIALAIGLIVLALWVAQDFFAPLSLGRRHRLGRLAGLSKVLRTHRRRAVEYLGAAFFYDPRRTGVVCPGRARDPPGCAGKLRRWPNRSRTSARMELPCRSGCRDAAGRARRALVDCQSERSEERLMNCLAAPWRRSPRRRGPGR